MSAEGACTDEAEGQQASRSPHQKQAHGPTCLQRRYDPPPLPPRLRAKRDYEREARAKHRHPPMTHMHFPMPPPNVVHFIPGVHHIHVPPMFHFNPPYNYDYPPHGPGFPVNTPPPYFLPPPPPPLHVHRCPPPLPPPPPPPPPPPSACIPPPLSIPSSPLHTQPGSPLRKQRPSKRARQKMRRRLERLRLEQEKVQEASIVASESGYETTGDHMTPAALTPAQHLLEGTPLAVSKNNSVEIKESKKEERLEEQEEGEREEEQREQGKGGEKSETDKLEETQKLQPVDVNRPETIYTDGDYQARIRSSSRSDSVSSATSVCGDNSLKKLLKDLHRCDVSLTRHQAVLNERCEAGLQQVRAVFVALREALSSREETLIQEMTSTKQTAAMILQRRKETISYLRGAAEKSHLLEETQAQELRQQIKQFVTDRKVDEEIGRITRFQADPDDLLPLITTFGKVLNAKLIYTSWEENVPAVIDQHTHRTECGVHSSSSTPPPTSVEGELAPTRSELDSAFLEELEHEPAEPVIMEEASTPGRPQSPAVVVTTLQPEDNTTSVVKSSTVEKVITTPAESHPSQPNDSSSSASSTATASPSHSLSTGSATSLASPMSSSSLQLSGSNIPGSYSSSSHVSGSHIPRSRIPKSHVPGPHTQSFKSGRKPRAQNPRCESDTFTPGDSNTRAKEVMSRKPLGGSGEGGAKDNDSYRSVHKSPKEASRLLEHTLEKQSDVPSGKYSLEELAMIQERVRHSLQRQGVLLYDPLTGNGPVRVHKEQLQPDADEHGIRKKKTPTQLRRERKKRQKERERRQREMERRATEKPLRAQEVSARHTQVSFGRTNPTGKGTDDSSSSDSHTGTGRNESLTQPMEQRKKKRKKWKTKVDKPEPATTREMEEEKEPQPVGGVDVKNSQVCRGSGNRLENGGMHTDTPAPGITSVSGQIQTGPVDEERSEAPTDISGEQSDSPATLQTHGGKSESPHGDQGQTGQSPALDFATTMHAESDGDKPSEAPSTQVGPTTSQVDPQSTGPEEEAGTTGKSQTPTPDAGHPDSTPPLASLVDRTTPPSSQSQSCPTPHQDGHEPLSDPTQPVKQVETNRQLENPVRAHAEEEQPEIELAPNQDGVEGVMEDSLSNPPTPTNPTEVDHQLPDLLTSDIDSGPAMELEPESKCKPSLRPAPTQHEE